MAKFELVVRKDSYGDEVSHTLLRDGKSVFRVHNLNECPEDAIIGRDLFNGADAMNLIQMGYELGKRGDVVEFIERGATQEDN